jgi:hypothetical protein
VDRSFLRIPLLEEVSDPLDGLGGLSAGLDDTTERLPYLL